MYSGFYTGFCSGGGGESACTRMEKIFASLAGGLGGS